MKLHFLNGPFMLSSNSLKLHYLSNKSQKSIATIPTVLV